MGGNSKFVLLDCEARCHCKLVGDGININPMTSRAQNSPFVPRPLRFLRFSTKIVKIVMRNGLHNFEFAAKVSGYRNKPPTHPAVLTSGPKQSLICFSWLCFDFVVASLKVYDFHAFRNFRSLRFSRFSMKIVKIVMRKMDSVSLNSLPL